MGSRAKDLRGKRFGRLVVVGRAPGVTDHHGHAVWKCVCDCGNTKVTTSKYLREGKVRSCGCLAHDTHKAHAHSLHKNGEKHGRWKHGGSVGGSNRLYRIWGAMKTRCYNPNHRAYAHYGGRGITVCAEWLHDFAAFQNWALSNGYHEGLSIDRTDNDKGYSLDNCQWVTQAQQNQNRRNSKKKTPLCEPGSNTEGSR